MRRAAGQLEDDPSAQSNPPRSPAAVIYERVKRDDSSWWLCVSKAEQKSTSALQKEMRLTLLSVTDPHVLLVLGLIDRATASPSELQQAIQRYLTSGQFCSATHGGTQEMMLRSFARAGALRFLVVEAAGANDASPEVRSIQYAPPTPHRGAHPSVTEIALHHCNDAGNRRSDANQWNLLSYRAHDGATHRRWLVTVDESLSQQQQRHRMLVNCVSESIPETARLAQIERHHQHALMIQRTQGSRSTPVDAHESTALHTSTLTSEARAAQSPNPLDLVIEETPQTPLSDSNHSEWRAADERPAAPSAIPVADTSAPEPSSRPTQLQRVVYVPISGLHNQCFRNAVARHFSYSHELQAIINDALAGINDAPTLASDGVSIQFDASAETVAEVKKNYLQSSDTLEGRWGGTLEMCLLSHAHHGAFSFLVIDHARKKTERYCSLPEGHPTTHTEIALHHCHTEGNNGPTMRPNHWATFDYQMEDGSKADCLDTSAVGDDHGQSSPHPTVASSCSSSGHPGTFECRYCPQRLC